MSAPCDSPTERRHQLDEVLLGYLEGYAVTSWPGGDGLTLEDVLRAYPDAVAATLAPGLQELQGRYPELAGELRAFFAGQPSPPPSGATP